MNQYKPFRDKLGRFASHPVVAEKEAAPAKGLIPFQKLRERFRKDVGKRRGECHYAVIREDERLMAHIQDVCHARLYGGWGVKGVILDARQHYDELVEGRGRAAGVPYFKGSDEAYRAWMEWLVNDSPFAEAFITKDFEEALEYGYLLDASKGCNLIYCAAIAMRTAHEFNYILSSWWHMRDWDISPLARFFLAHSLNQQGEYFSAVCRQGNHIVFSSRATVSILAETIKRGRMYDEGNLFNQERCRSACHTPFTGQGDDFDVNSNTLYMSLESLCTGIPGGFAEDVKGIPVEDAENILRPLINQLEGKK